MYTTLERFLKYVTYDTQSAANASVVPSTPGQKVLAGEMKKELEELGLQDVVLTDRAYVTATLPANTKKKVPAVGFITHMDTATELTGRDVKARVVRNYDGGDVVLNREQNIVLSPRDFPFMTDYRGMDLVVTDGTTLLGADNKAGMAEVMGAVDYLVKHPEIEHGAVKLAFTPDEEVGEMAAGLDIEKFGADFAYTLDGGPLGEVSYENFNAENAIVKIQGRAVHPGTAKGMMLNAVTMGHELLSLFPDAETPEHTEMYEGFYHCLSFQGTTEEAELQFIIRDHDSKKFEERKDFMRRAVEWMNQKYGPGRFTLTMKEQYRNMADKMEGHMDIVDTAVEAMKEVGITPFFHPMRGCTDGASLTWRGLKTPNLFIGGHNYHGRFEFIPVQVMEKATETVLKILELTVKKAGQGSAC